MVGQTSVRQLSPIYETRKTNHELWSTNILNSEALNKVLKRVSSHFHRNILFPNKIHIPQFIHIWFLL